MYLKLHAWLSLELLRHIEKQKTRNFSHNPEYKNNQKEKCIDSFKNSTCTSITQ